MGFELCPTFHVTTSKEILLGFIFSPHALFTCFSVKKRQFHSQKNKTMVLFFFEKNKTQTSPTCRNFGENSHL